jgi:hypothetical protein
MLQVELLCEMAVSRFRPLLRWRAILIVETAKAIVRLLLLVQLRGTMLLYERLELRAPVDNPSHESLQSLIAEVRAASSALSSEPSAGAQSGRASEAGVLEQLRQARMGECAFPTMPTDPSPREVPHCRSIRMA